MPHPRIRPITVDLNRASQFTGRSTGVVAQRPIEHDATAWIWRLVTYLCVILLISFAVVTWFALQDAESTLRQNQLMRSTANATQVTP